MTRIGFGYDSHRLSEGRELILGGVKIPYDKGLVGHSDADVLLHAVIDALLGASRLGNIGGLFPDSRDEFQDADSIILLENVVRLLSSSGWSIINIDSVIVIEKPKIGPFVAHMEENIAKACSLPNDLVSVKPKTNEGMGYEGSGEGVTAYAVCLLELNRDIS